MSLPILRKKNCFADSLHTAERYGKRKMDKKQQEELREQKNLNEFNSITQKKKPENQNQTHNVREEGIHPINRKR